MFREFNWIYSKIAEKVMSRKVKLGQLDIRLYKQTRVQLNFAKLNHAPVVTVHFDTKF